MGNVFTYSIPIKSLLTHIVSVIFWSPFLGGLSNFLFLKKEKKISWRLRNRDLKNQHKKSCPKPLELGSPDRLKDRELSDDLQSSLFYIMFNKERRKGL